MTPKEIRMAGSAETTMPAADSIVAALCTRHLTLALWLLATIAYGTVAGLLLQAQPYIAAAAMVAIWLAGITVLAAVRRGRRFTEPRPRAAP
jgi:hypothetical protein